MVKCSHCVSVSRVQVFAEAAMRLLRFRSRMYDGSLLTCLERWQGGPGVASIGLVVFFLDECATKVSCGGSVKRL